VSIWEVHLLSQKGRLDLKGGPSAWVERALIDLPVREAVLTSRVAAASSQLRLPNRDPIDSFIAGTAIAYGLTLVTSDQRLAETPGIETLLNW
jgi:PIN domain nuclease of toxin-antitoxin system